MWNEILIGLALVMVFEGFFPAINPGAYRRTIQMMSEKDDRFLRNLGLIMMVMGALLIYFIKN